MIAELTRPINIEIYSGLVTALTDSIARSDIPTRDPVAAGKPNLDRRDREEMELNKILIRGMDQAMFELAESRPPFGLVKHNEPFDPFDPGHYVNSPRESAYKVLADSIHDTLSDSLRRRLLGIFSRC